MAFRNELETHIESESTRPDAIGWGMDYDRVAKTIYIFNDNGPVATIAATPEMVAMSTQELVQSLFHDTIDEVRRRRKTRGPGGR